MYAQPSNNYIQQLIIAADIARSGTATVGTEVSPAILANGEVVITDVGGRILDIATVLTVDKIYVVQGRGATNQLKRSKLIDATELATAFSRAYAAEVQQVAYIGFNGTAGTIQAINSNYYILELRLRRQTFSERHGVYMPIQGKTLSDATATQEEVTNGVYADIAFNLAQWQNPIITPQRVNSGTKTAAGATGGNITFTPGSNIVTAAAATDINNMVVGDYICNGTGATNAIYKVTAIAGTNMTIDVAYQGLTVVTVAGTANVRIAVATAQAGNWGIQFTGIDQPFNVMTNPLSIVGFDIVIKAFGTTPITYATQPFIGQGTWKQISEIENDSWGNYGQITTYMEYPGTDRFNDVVTGARYSTVLVNWLRRVAGAPDYSFRGTVQIACANDTVLGTFDTNITGAATSCIDVLDGFLTANGLPSILPLP